MTFKGVKKRFSFFVINNLVCGVRPRYWGFKRNLLNWAGMNVGKGAKIVGPIHISGTLIVGEDTWVGSGFTLHGNGTVIIGNNCDIAPDVTFLTGSHEVGKSHRRAGNGIEFKIDIGEGTWVGAKSTFMGNTVIGKGCVVGACSLVNKSFEYNIMLAGAPAKEIKKLV